MARRARRCPTASFPRSMRYTLQGSLGLAGPDEPDESDRRPSLSPFAKFAYCCHASHASQARNFPSARLPVWHRASMIKRPGSLVSHICDVCMPTCPAGTRRLAWLHSDVRRRTIPPSPPFDMGGLKLLAPFKPQEKQRDVKRTPSPVGMLWVFSAGFLARARDPSSHLPAMSDRESIGPVRPRRGPLEVFSPP